MRRNHTQQCGYTLIEMLLVAIIIGIAAMYTVGFMNRTQQFRIINDTARRMENMMKLALAYHAEHDQWPDSYSTLTAEFGVRETMSCTVWPNDGNTTHICPKRAIIEISADNTPVGTTPPSGNDINPLLYTNFKVSLTLAPEFQNALHEIAGRIPSAYIKGNTVTMLATSRLAESQEKNVYGYISSAGFARNGDTITFPEKCYTSLVPGDAQAMEKHIITGMFTGITDFKQWYDDSGIIGLQSDYQRYMRIIATVAQPDSSDSSNIWLRDWSLVMKYDEDTTYYDYHELYNTVTGDDDDSNYSRMQRPYQYSYYMTVCLPPNMWQAAFQTSLKSTTLMQKSQQNSMQYVFNNGQCNKNWANSYNCGLYSEDSRAFGKFNTETIYCQIFNCPNRIFD